MAKTNKPVEAQVLPAGYVPTLKKEYKEKIVNALKEQFGIDIEKNKIVQAEPIKNYGSYTVKAKLGYEISGNINLLVVEG